MAAYKVKAVYEYSSEEPDDLTFAVGQVITITEEVDADWLEGEYTDASGIKKSGIFPNNFVEKYEPEVPSRPARPTRPKTETQSPVVQKEPEPEPAREPEPEPETAAEEEEEKEEYTPPVPAASKPQPPPVSIPAEQPKARDEVRSPPSAASERSPATQTEPPAAPRPVPSEPAPASAESKKPPPPVAPKSNAFKDRIAAFNQAAAAPVMPFQPQKSQPGNFIKKPFVAPPPSSGAYIPPPQKQEPVSKPYRREEDPEIKQRQEEDKAAAEAAGFRDDSQQTQQEEEGEDAPKPQSLKDRIALLQKQQAEQAQRRAGAGEKPKKTPSRKASEPAAEDDEESLERVRSPGEERQSLDVSRDRPRVPSAQRRPQEPMSPLPDVPQHEILSGGEEADQSAAGETTEDDAGTIGPDDSDDRPKPPPRAETAPKVEPDVGDEEDTTEDAEEEEDSMDEEERRRHELRQRMAKMSGGMGMAGMFGPPGGMPMPGKSAPKKKSSTKDSERHGSVDAQSPTSPATEEPQRMPMMPIPGMQRVQSPPTEEPRLSVEKEREPEVEPISGQRHADEVPDVEDVKPAPPPRASTTEERGAAPPVPKERPLSMGAPPVPGGHPSSRPPPSESRPVPPPPPPATATPLSPGPGSESDDEMSMHNRSAQTPTAETPLSIRTAPPPVPGQQEPTSAQPSHNKRASYFGTEDSSPHTAPPERRTSKVPLIPGTSPIVSPRPPPPPPPQVPSRQSTDLQTAPATNDEERGESDYEGDYDTDIASSVKHKDALKAHNRDISMDESTTGDDTPVFSPSHAAPPPPITRAVPPPPPQAAPKSRQSMDTPRAPPPAPPQRDMSNYGEDYDPYRYNEAARSPPPVPGQIPVAAPPIPPREAEQVKEDSSDDMYSASPPRKSMDRPPPPPPTHSEQQPPMPTMPPMPPASQPNPPPRAPPRQSLDVQRTPNMGRRSMEQGRPPTDNGQIANDIYLSEDTPWWTAEEPLPPVLQSRRGVDILSESEESTTSKRGGRTTVSKDIYILYIDYSQTIITARFDSQDPTSVFLEQRHEPPPSKLRQDQLESYWQRFGSKIADTAASLGNSKKDSTVGDGTPFALVSDLIKAQPEALHPVGIRAFGALVYSNLANASVMQFDEIRAGDIVTLRNAKFEGKHSGPMHQKYKQDLGAGHVAIVGEWDGTRKKIRAWEQGREKAKVRMESFRLGDLKSGEVRVWRVVGREWVGWEGQA